MFHLPHTKGIFCLFLFLAEHCILHCVFIGLSKYRTNEHCFPKRFLFLFKSWMLLICPPSLPLPPFSSSPLTSHHDIQNSLRSMRRLRSGEEMEAIMQPFVNNQFKCNWEKGWEFNLLPSFPSDFSVLFLRCAVLKY